MAVCGNAFAAPNAPSLPTSPPAVPVSTPAVPAATPLPLGTPTGPAVPLDTPVPAGTPPATAPSAPRHLSISEAIDISLSHNPAIAAQRKALEAAIAGLNQDYRLYYPQLSLSAGYTDNFTETVLKLPGSPSAITPGAKILSTVSSYQQVINPAVSVSQTLYDFDQRKLIVRAAEQSVEQNRQLLQQSKNDTTLTVRQQFFGAYVDQVLVQINEQSVADYREHLHQAEELYRAGTKARVDVTTARANLATAEFNLVKAVGALRTAWVNLNVAMGLPRDVTYNLDIESVDTVPSALDRARLLGVALAHRPELLNYLAQMRATLYNLAYQYATRQPTLSSSASYGYTGLPSPLAEYWNVGVSLSWNVFIGHYEYYLAAQYRAQAEQLALQLEQSRQQVFQQVENDCINFDQARAEIDSAVIGLENAQENYRLVSERYKLGLGSSVDFIDAQTTLTQAQSNLATAHNDQRLARAQLEHDVGVYTIDALPAPAPEVHPDPIPGSKLPLPGVPRK